ncbi:SLAP domain-containing protein [Lactobacillus sp. LL6]|uniref:SLAP domain-containing protein n=1 Tax=Lactobacillus sp. LL6 TaxID=2596827 RepID=UPI0011863C16|nr:SLAP domain-containing protein [Lactobacillus sp. LL6]TSO26129.1 hypothetical protein FOD82_03400 [Lactobacillus sp. LL6]
MKKNIKFGAIAVALLALAPVFSSTTIVKADVQKAVTEQSVVTKQNTGDIVNVTMKRGGFIYDQNGDFAVNNQRYIFFKKGKTLGAWNKGKVVIINGEKFYQVGENEYVKFDCIKSKKNKNGQKKHLKKASKKAIKKNKNKRINKKLAKKLAKKVIVVE